MHATDPMRERARLEAEQRKATEDLLRPNPTLERLKARSRGRTPPIQASQRRSGISPITASAWARMWPRRTRQSSAVSTGLTPPEPS